MSGPRLRGEETASGAVVLGWQFLWRPKARGAHVMLDPRRGPEEQEPEEFGEEELDWDADAWKEEELEGLDEEQSDLDARASRIA